MQTLVNATKALKKIQSGKKVHITTYKDFCKRKNFNIPEFKNEYQFSTQPNMVLQLMKIGNQNKITSIPFQKISRINTKNSKKAAGIEKENCICKK
jgi:hypothetical protein